MLLPPLPPLLSLRDVVLDLVRRGELLPAALVAARLAPGHGDLQAGRG